MNQIYKVLHVFAGSGGGGLGFQQARAQFRGVFGQFETLCGIDADPDACEDFRRLTGAPAVQMDLFSAEDYAAFHGRKPPADWPEATAEDIRRACGGRRPDVVFTSPPCKGFSGLLPAASGKSPKYQALNRLTFRGVWLVLEAFRDDPPGLVLLENVPRITIRGKALLKDIKGLLRAYGYLIHESAHNCGELGNLAQNRQRYLLVARRPERVPVWLYQPPRLPVRAIGDVIGPMPLPDDPAGGPMHRTPRLQWRTWVRLALIPAGGDWRDLRDIEPSQYRIEPVESRHTMKYRVQEWENPAATVTGIPDVQAGAQIITDPRLPSEGQQHANKYRVEAWQEPGHTVTGNDRLGSGAPSVADPRKHMMHTADGRYDCFHNIHRVRSWDEPSGAVTAAGASAKDAPLIADPRLGHHARDGSHKVAAWDGPSTSITGSAGVTGSNGVGAVADPRGLGGHDSKFRVQRFDRPARTVTGDVYIGSGAPSISDPRLGHEPMGNGQGGGAYHVQDWDEPGGCVTGDPSPRKSGGNSVIADPRLGCTPRKSTYRVIRWDEPALAVTGAGDVHTQGSAIVADPRIPGDTEQGVWVIVALDGTWHRPLTTYELWALQGGPLTMADGSPVCLAGKSDARWRERIGNMVPPPTARAIARQMLLCLMQSEAGAWEASATGVWVEPQEERGEVPCST